MSTSSNAANVQEDKMVTTVRPNQYAYTWEIQNCSTWLATVKGLQSSFQFPYDESVTEKWVLNFNPRSSSEPDYCSLGLEIVNTPLDSKAKIEVEFELSMETSTGCIIQKSTFECDFAKSNTWSYSKFIKREMLLEKVKIDDQLFIKCKIVTDAKVSNDKKLTKKLPETLPGSLSNDLKNLVDGEKYGDVTVQVADQRFLAYKGILSARSSVFASMFEHDMLETIENCVTIDDIEPDVFRELLRYIYTDQLTLTSMDTMAHKLYTAADKYDIATLKSLCRRHIMAKLRWKTAADTLVLADMHNDHEMKQETLQFLSGSVAVNVTKTTGWKTMVQTHPHLVNETVWALAAKLPPT